ncbi:MAG: hypothetical protein WC460_04415 [Patescibacteria group bacterium]
MIIEITQGNWHEELSNIKGMDKYLQTTLLAVVASHLHRVLPPSCDEKTFAASFKEIEIVKIDGKSYRIILKNERLRLEEVSS